MKLTISQVFYIISTIFIILLILNITELDILIISKLNSFLTIKI